MERFQRMITALKRAGLDCPAARYVGWGMLETGLSFEAVLEGLAVYLGIRKDVLIREFAALCWPRPAPARFVEFIKEVRDNESGVHAG